MSEDVHETAIPDFDAALARLRRDRLRFEGIVPPTALEIVEDALEKLALTPEAAKWEEGGITLADTLLGAALTAEGAPPGVSGLGVRGFDFLLHTALTVALNKFRADQARAAQQAKDFASS